MPYAVRKKGIRRKRPGRRSSGTVRGVTSSKTLRKAANYVPRGPASPFPLTLTTKLSYSTEIGMTQTVPGLPVFNLFRANSMYDPDQTGGGIQPRYFDQLCGANNGNGVYNRYRVLHSSISCKIFPLSSTAVDANACFSIIPLNASSSLPATLAEMRERPFSKFTYMTTLGSYKPYSVSNSIGMAKFLGNKDLQDNEDASAPFNNNPIDIVNWGCMACSINSSGLPSVDFSATITFTVQFYNLNDVVNS